MEKRGQELTITTLLLIVIGVVVAVVLIIGFTQGFDFIFGKVDVLPGQTLEALVQTCGVSGQNNLVADYCKTFKEVELSGVDRYVNCQYEDIENLVGENKLQNQGAGTPCGDERDNSRDFCEDLREEAEQKQARFDASQILVNNDDCAGWGVTDYNP